MTRLLGVTGGIGAGKSAACEMLADLGARVFVADAVAKDLMEREEAVRAAIIATLGPEAYTPKLNRAWLAARVFGDSAALAQLNAIVHPRVRVAFIEVHKAAEKEGVPLLVHEAALIYEAGLDKYLDFVAVVDAPVSVCIHRVMARDGVSEAAVRARMQHQLSREERTRRADYVLDNSGPLTALHSQVVRLYGKVTVREGR